MATRFLSRPVSATRLLFWSLIVVFVLQLLASGPGRPSAFDLNYGLSARGLAEGRWWTLLTYGWLHQEGGVPWHLVWNLLWLNFLGSTVETVLGWKRFLGLYLASLLGAAVAWRLFAGSGSPGLLIGASGAVFGLMAAYSRLEGGGLLVRMAVASFFRVAVGFEVLCVLFNWLPGVSHWAHLGGAFGGWWFSRVFGKETEARRASAPPPGAGFKEAPRPETETRSREEKEIPADEGLFSNYNSTPQPPEGR